MKPGALLVIDRDWASYAKGTVFQFVEEVPCGPVDQADGSTINPVNLRVVLENEPLPVNANLARTIPAEYAIEMPRVNDAYDVEANQGTRDGTVIATCGSQALIEYEMPAGRTFGRVIDVLKPDWHRAVCLANLPKKWQKELAA